MVVRKEQRGFGEAECAADVKCVTLLSLYIY